MLIVGAGLGGLAGEALGHYVGWAMLASAPPYAVLAVHSGLSLGPAAFGLKRRPSDGLLALALPVVIIALPLAFMKPNLRHTAWIYAAALWLTLGTVGWRLARWKGALAGPAGALTGYLLFSLLPNSGLPSLAASMTNGLFTGAGLGCGIAIASRRLS